MRNEFNELLNSRLILEISAIASVLVAWWLLSLSLPVRVLPNPYIVLNYVVDNFTTNNATLHVFNTMIRITVGFLASLGIGIPLGVIMGTRRIWENYLGTWVMVGLSLPDIIWPIMGIIWFGMVETVAYFSITMIVFPLVTVNIWEGVKAVDKSLVDMAKIFRISKLRTIRTVYVPMLMPYLLSTMRYSFAISWKIILLAEMFGLSSGVGYMIQYWYRSMQIGQVLAWAVTFIVIMIFVERFVFDRIGKRAFKWRPEARL